MTAEAKTAASQMEDEASVVPVEFTAEAAAREVTALFALCVSLLFFRPLVEELSKSKHLSSLVFSSEEKVGQMDCNLLSSFMESFW